MSTDVPDTTPPTLTDTGYRESSVTRVSVRTAAILLTFTLAFTALMSGTYQATAPLLEASARTEKLRLISEVLPRDLYDNDLIADKVVVPPNKSLGIDVPTELYRARKNGMPVALVMEAAALDGYSGRIGLLLAIAADGTLIAQRVTSHRETPGLGDYIDPKKDKNKTRPWITQFTGKSFRDISPSQWRVRKDGGVIEQRAGATISARAVTNASGRAMAWATERADSLFAQPVGTTWKETPQ
jgi:Na+-translocating ferredoxin:NAD+ oxidoreductase subunit G